jgi:hypothetical protein
MDRSSVHVLTFPDLPSVAAFIAAASREMNSPRQADRSAVQIWVNACQVYLSDAAHAMATRAFAPLPVSERLALPADARLVLDATTPAMGLLDAERRLAP